MPRQEIGDFSGQYPTADMLDARNLRGNVISGQVFEIAQTGGVIRTSDFTTSGDGWAIFSDGTAWFGDINLTGGGTFKTATSGQRVEITSSGTDAINIYDDTNSTPHVITGYSSGGAYGMEMSYLGDSNKSFVLSNDVILNIVANTFLYGNLRRDTAAGTYNIGEAAYSFSTAYIDKLLTADGSVSAPSHSFSNDTNTGMFRSGADDGRLVAGGSSIAQFTSGRFGPGSDNAISLGASGLRWTEVFAVNGTINTSDMRYKDELVDPVPGLSFISKLHPFKYTWKSGDDPKVHWGLSAQQINALIGTEGPFREGDILGVAYMEIVPALVVAIQELEARLEEYANKLESLGS